MQIIKFEKNDLEKINRYFIADLTKKIDDNLENIAEFARHNEHLHILEELCEFTDNLRYTAEIYEFIEISKLAESVNKIFNSVLQKQIEFNSELEKIVNAIFSEIKKWCKINNDNSKDLKKFSDLILPQLEDALNFAILSKRKKEEERELDKIVPISSSELRQLKESIYDLYTNFSYLTKTINTNLPLRYSKKQWFKDYKNIESAFISNLSNLQREYFEFRRMEIKSMLQDLEYEIRNYAMQNNKNVKLNFINSDIKMDIYCIEKVYQILFELLKNSVEHSFIANNTETINYNEITVKFSDEKSNIFIEVSDNGTGFNLDEILKIAKSRGMVNDSELENINEIFFNVLLLVSPYLKKSEKKQCQGLKSVKSNIEKINANIKFRVKDTKSATIFIEIPLYKKIV